VDSGAKRHALADVADGNIGGDGPASPHNTHTHAYTYLHMLTYTSYKCAYVCANAHISR